MIPKTVVPIEGQLTGLAEVLDVSANAVRGYLTDLRTNGRFLLGINTQCAAEPSWGVTRFVLPSNFRAWREALYICVRAIQPDIVVETGVHHGFSSAFILQALRDNGRGKLFSVDIDPDSDGYALDQSLRAIPKGRKPGWIIPDGLRDRWELRLMSSQEFFTVWEGEPTDIQQGIDIFIHDSDHSEDNVRAEIAWAWPRLNKYGLLVVDNIEQSRKAVQGLLCTMPSEARWSEHTIVNVAAPDEARWETMFIRRWRG